jgi:hypothetical protein
MNRKVKAKRRWCLFAILCAVALVVPSGALAEPDNSGPWWDVEPEDEEPSSYYDSILYSEIPPKLREIEVNSNRVKVDVIGQSAGGRNLFLVTLSAPEAMGRLGQYKAIRETMLKDPEKAQEMIDRFGDFKVPFFVNGSIHGNEYPGTDAAMRLIETLAYDDSEEVQAILESVILLVNVVQNPDGRVMGTRRNSNGFDINRDFFTQSQPESRITARIFAEWNPMVVLDLHGFVNPMLIEPCTPPHNPNYEYDLYIQWALGQAEAMEAEVLDKTALPAQIPYRDDNLGWDDWPPSYVPMYAMYHGSYGHTLETPSRYPYPPYDPLGEERVDAHYWAVWGALNFVVENREAMIHDQIEIFRRGYLDLLQQPIPPELLPDHPQYEELMIQEFPAAYVIPADEPFQVSPHQPAQLVDFLLYNGVQVEQASQSFHLDGVDYPKGTYVVWLDQPKRGLANVILDAGLDLSDTGLTFYSPPSVWSHPLLWGVRRAVMEEEMEIKTHAVNNADPPRGSAEGGKAAAYGYLPTSVAAFQATNDLLARGVSLNRAPQPFDDSGRHFGAGAIIIPADPALANELANGYALDLFALEGMPAGAVPMVKQRIAVYGDEGVRHALETLGFDYDSLGTSDLNNGDLESYDVFINRDRSWGGLEPEGQASVQAWFAAGGNYVGLGYRGRAIDFANTDNAGWVDVDYGYISGNAILEIDYNPEDSIAAGFLEDGHAFVYRSVWFTDSGAMEESAYIDDGAFLVSGFWENWETSGANGKPVILHDSLGDSDVTLIGINNTFRGHPENTFRLLGNAIYHGLD